MPFILTNTPTTFMRLMDDVFNNSFVVVYLDDILIFSRTWGEHMWHIQQFLSTLQQHKLYSNLENCSFGMNKVQYLGYIVDEHGVHVDPAKIQVSCDWPAPTTLTELQSFLGLANFYRRFMLGFSHIAWSLSQVTKSGGREKFMGGKDQQGSFDNLNHRLCSTPVLSLPDLQQPLDIDTDAYDYVVVYFSLITVIRWHTIVRHSLIRSINTPPMTRKCIPLYKPVVNGNITF
jgi:hypothetical protein